jgi:hypothetical protein
MSSWGSLGPHVFGIGAGPSAETLKMGASLAEHARIGRKPTQQLAALQLQELEWTINLHDSRHDVAAVIEALTASMDAGEILDLAHGDQPGTGAWAGQWVITDIEVESLARAPGGAIYSADVKLRMREWAQREGIEVSQRKPPPAIKPKAPRPIGRAGTAPDGAAEPTGPGYEGGKK